MRGIYTPVTKIRRQVFSEIARLAFEGWDHDKVEELPYKILTGEVPQYRDSIFKERAIVGERLEGWPPCGRRVAAPSCNRGFRCVRCVSR